MVAAVRRRLVILGARLDPLHGTTQLHRAEHRDEVALDLRNLAAEAAADFRRDDAKPILGHPVTSDMMNRTMCGFCVVFQSVSSPVAGTYCASAPRVSIAVGINRCCTMRSRTTTSAFLNAASTSPPATVQWNAMLFGRLGVQLRSAGLDRLLRIDCRRQRIVVDLDQVSGIGGLLRRFGHDDRDGVADVPNNVSSQAAGTEPS